MGTEPGTPTTPTPGRMPLWRLALLGVVRAVQGLVSHPLARMWRSDDPIDAYGLNHLTSVAGDALLAISLSDSVFFSVPVGQARLRVTAYLLLTMLPLALAGPLMAPILDRAGPRRSITFSAAAARAGFAILLAPRLATNWLFPLALAILVCSKVHTIAKNALTMAYASKRDGLMRANARLGRVGVAGAVAALPLGVLALKAIDPAAPLYVAAAIYGVSAALTVRLPHPGRRERPVRDADAPDRAPMGRVARLQLPAMGAVGMRAAAGFLLFLLAFALRDAEVPAWWFAIVAGAGVVGGFVADVVAPALRTDRREEAVVIASVSAAGIGALLASQLFGLPLLTIYALAAGAATEFARLAFQALMQRHAPPEALGRVFVRYEVLFQVAWVLGAFVPVLLPIPFRTGVLVLALFYGTLGAVYIWRLRRRRGARSGNGGLSSPGPRRGRKTREATMGEFLTVGAADAVAEGHATAFEVEGARVGVARVEGRLYAFSDVCTHQGCNLTAGDDLDGTEITCECHGSVFAIDTGEVRNGPAARPIETYGAREVDGQIQIEV